MNPALVSIRSGFGSIRAGIGSLIAGKSFAAGARAWARGDDVVDGMVTRLQQPYAQSAWVFSAINLIGGEFSGLPLKFYLGDQEYQDAAFDAWWAKPAIGPDGKRIDRADVDRLLNVWLGLEGEFFLILDDSWMLAGLKRNPALLSPFIIASPLRMRLIVQGGELLGYEYVDPAGRASRWLPEQVIHHKLPNPYDDWRGHGAAQVANITTESVFLTSVYIRDLMRNNGDQGFVVIAKGGPLEDNQREQIVADLRAKRAALRAGLARDIILATSGEITIEKSKEEAASVDLTNTKAMSHQEIYITFGVPPSMSTVKAAYSIGKDSDRYQLITGTSQPTGRKITSAYADLAGRMTGKPLSAEHDWDDHPVMQQVRNDRLLAAMGLWDKGWSWQDINEYLDLGMKPFPGWNIAYLPFSVAPIDGLAALPAGGNPSDDPALGEGDKSRRSDIPEIAILRTAILARQRVRNQTVDINVTAAKAEADALAVFTCGCCCGDAIDKDPAYVAQKGTPSQAAQWRASMIARRESMRSIASAFTRVLTIARVETLRKIEGETGKAIVSAVTKTAAEDLTFDPYAWGKEFLATMRKQITGALDNAGGQLMKELGKTDPFHFAPHDVLGFLGDRDTKLAGVPEKIAGRIRSALQVGLDAGDSTAQLAARVRTEFNSIGKVESLRIAQTETSAAYGFGRHEAMVQAGVLYKAWLTSGNANVRLAHQQAGLEYPRERGIPLDQPFIVDGEALMHPGDSAGSPGNVINCHCIQIAVPAPDES